MRLLPPLVFEGPEGLRVTLAPSGSAVFRAPPDGAELEPERAVALAFDLLGQYAPELLEAIERHVRGRMLRLVRGGDPGGDAA